MCKTQCRYGYGTPNPILGGTPSTPRPQNLTLLDIDIILYYSIIGTVAITLLNFKGLCTMTNTNKQVTTLNTNVEQALAKARHEVAESQLRQYGAERAYSVLLNSKFGFDWFTVEVSDTSDNGKAVKAEKKELYGELNKAGHTNPSTVWARVRKYGKEERYGKEAQAEGTEGEQGESGKDNAPRSPMLRNVEELTALYKFNMKQDNLAPQVAKANAFIIKALEELGVKVHMVDTK